jgi:hypothetical protein
LGYLGAGIASRVIVSLLYGVSRFDPITHLFVIALLAGVSGIACWVPAWRAPQVDPSTILRAEQTRAFFLILRSDEIGYVRALFRGMVTSSSTPSRHH